VNDEFERKCLLSVLRYYILIRLTDVGKASVMFPGPQPENVTRNPPEYRAGVAPVQPRRLIITFNRNKSTGVVDCRVNKLLTIYTL